MSLSSRMRVCGGFRVKGHGFMNEQTRYDTDAGIPLKILLVAVVLRPKHVRLAGRRAIIWSVCQSGPGNYCEIQLPTQLRRPAQWALANSDREWLTGPERESVPDYVGWQEVKQTKQKSSCIINIMKSFCQQQAGVRIISSHNGYFILHPT